EDGIRYWSVTGVQTCALPIFPHHDTPVGFHARPTFVARESRPEYRGAGAGPVNARYPRFVCCLSCDVRSIPAGGPIHRCRGGGGFEGHLLLRGRGEEELHYRSSRNRARVYLFRKRRASLPLRGQMTNPPKISQ